MRPPSPDRARAIPPAERQILGLLRQMEQHRQDWATGKVSSLDRESIWRHGELFYGPEQLDWEEAWNGLLDRGWIVQREEGYRLGEGIRPRAEEIRKAHLAEGFGRLQIRCHGSPAYRELCRRVFGPDLLPFSLTEERQLAAVADLLARRPRARVLDLGCGIGTLTEALRQRTGEAFTGVDLSGSAIRYARRRFAGGGAGGAEDLSFQSADLDSWQPPPGTYDAVVGIDVLYFLDDLASTLRRLLRVLPSGGEMLFLCSDLAEGPGDGSLPRSSRLSRALKPLPAGLHMGDFSAVEEELWRRQVSAVEDLREAFDGEGNGDLAEMLGREAGRGARWAAEGRIRRYLYRAVKD